jgi:hypothetical protein
LGATPLRDYGEYAAYVRGLRVQTLEVLDLLDHLIRVANPGSQLAMRQQYVGYRRFDARQPAGAAASRSQIFASLLPRRALIRVVLPLPVDDFRDVSGVQDLRGRGHHGIGDLAVDISTVQEARELMETFHSWLGPATR